ncbi:putative cupredoxin-like copper-binding protein [Jeotgalibacillus terrae]|uniref:plastocyanin/azurin family copper-binding protein n=1 Tax=Jeotgalibacillus terrae TaxID=587735 RepID=UPI00195E855C|nr:putative cupredoxin-like copper-binding protein [Jeotgalibacillus terrae]
MIIALSFILYGTIVALMYTHKTISKMNGMMISMSTAMSTGLIIGTILGIYFSDNLFIATVYSMMTGLVVGAIPGNGIGKVALLDGMLSGVMAGMMGVMLGSMIQSENYDSMVKILFFSHCFISALVIRLIGDEVNSTRKLLINAVSNPLKAGVIFIILFFIVEMTGPLFFINEIKSHPHVNNNQILSENHTTKEPQSSISEKVEVKMNEYTYYPSKIQLQKGSLTEIVLTNTGTIDHDLQFENNTIEILNNLSNTHNHGTNSNKVHIHLKPGESKSVQLIAKKATQVPFFCSLPNHKEQGMEGIFQVN